MKHMIGLILAGLTCGCNSAATDVKDDGNWIQLAKGKQANYEFDLDSTSIEPTLHARTVKLRITPLGPYVREDKITVSKIFEYGVVLCDQKRYIQTGQDHFDTAGKFIDANTGIAFYRATGRFGDLITHLVSVACEIPLPGQKDTGTDV